jgi:integrase
MVYSFVRVGAAATMRVGDYFQHRKRLWLRLHEKGGKRHEVPCHPTLEGYLDAYIKAAGIAGDNKGRLFRSMHKGDKLTDKPITRFDVFHMIKRRAKAADLPYSTSCHTFRATGITTYLQKRRYPRARPNYRESRIAQDNQALRPHQGGAFGG